MAIDPALAKSLFLRASDIADPDERAAYLDRECGGESELRARVEALLRAHESAPWFDSDAPGVARRPEAAPASQAPDAVAPAPDEVAGAVIDGKYTLVEPIGEGGMGLVWRAKQTEPVKRYVAIKLIRAGMDSRQVLARFDAERQALALMDHPHIAKVLDGGLHRLRPYFVMELVKGVPITEFCDARKLSPRERLELFVPVCEAIQHAHQKGIIHRDIKPSNVLVALYDDRPVVKVIDFGVAKATGGALTEQTLDTGFGAVVGTPQYMSPEQAAFNNVDIDTRSDVYALGVLLYELLTGSPPFSQQELEKKGLLEMLRVVREEEPSRPSTKLSTAAALPTLSANRGTEPKKLTGILRSELDWIVMKALEKDRARRYETANGFAADVRRYLGGEAVQAHPPSAAYRVRKFVRRHKGQVVAASLLLLALVGGVAGTTWGMLKAREQRAEALRQETIARGETAEKEKARAAEAERAEGERRAKREAEDQRETALKRLRQIERSNGILAQIFEDLDIRQVNESEEPLAAVLAGRLLKAVAQLEGEAVGGPLVVADLQHRLGTSLAGLGYAQEAIPLFTKAIATYAEQGGREAYETLRVMNSLANAYGAVGRQQEALAMSQEVLRRTTTSLGTAHPDTIVAMNNLAAAYDRAGQAKLALPLLEEALATSRRTFGTDDYRTLGCLHSLGKVWLQAGNHEAALPLLEEALKLAEALLGGEHPDTLQVLNNLGGCYQAMKRPEEALPLVERILRLRRQKLGTAHPDTIQSMNNLAAVYEALGKRELCVPLLEEAVKLQKDKLGIDHPSTLVSMSNLAEAYRNAKQLDLSVPLFEETLRIANGKLGPDHPIVLKCSHGLAAAYWAASRFDRSVPMFEQLVRHHEARLGRASPVTLNFIANLATNYLDSGRRADAIPLLEEVNGAAKRHPQLAWIRGPLLHAYAEAGEEIKLALLLLEGLPEARRSLPSEGPELAGMLARIGVGLLKGGKWEEAEPLLRESLAIRERTEPAGWSTFNSKSMLGGALLGQRKYADAEPLLLQGYEGMKAREMAIPPQGRLRLTEAAGRLVELYEATQRPEEAAKWSAERQEREAAAPSGKGGSER